MTKSKSTTFKKKKSFVWRKMGNMYKIKNCKLVSFSKGGWTNAHAWHSKQFEALKKASSIFIGWSNLDLNQDQTCLMLQGDPCQNFRFEIIVTLHLITHVGKTQNWPRCGRFFQTFFFKNLLLLIISNKDKPISQN